MSGTSNWSSYKCSATFLGYPLNALSLRASRLLGECSGAQPDILSTFYTTNSVKSQSCNNSYMNQAEVRQLRPIDDYAKDGGSEMS